MLCKQSRLEDHWQILSSFWLAAGPCLAGADAICPKAKVSGYYTPGTFQQYCIGPAKYDRLLLLSCPVPLPEQILTSCSYVTPIPDGLSSADAAVSVLVE